MLAEAINLRGSQMWEKYANIAQLSPSAQIETLKQLFCDLMDITEQSGIDDALGHAHDAFCHRIAELIDEGVRF